MKLKKLYKYPEYAGNFLMKFNMSGEVVYETARVYFYQPQRTWGYSGDGYWAGNNQRWTGRFRCEWYEIIEESPYDTNGKTS